MKKSKGKKVFLKDTITTSEDEEVTKTNTKKGKQTADDAENFVKLT